MTNAFHPYDPSAPTDEVKSLPHNLEAEQALLGSVMFDNDIFYDVADGLRGFDFYEPFHQRLYDAIASNIRRGQLAEPTVLVEWFTEDPAFKEFGGLRYLADLVDRAPPSANSRDYARIITDLAMRRHLIETAGEVLKSATDPTETALDLVLAAERSMGEITMNGPVKSAFEDLSTIYATQLAKSRSLDGQVPGISTGIPDLDKKLGGLRRKNVIVVAGRPGMGKSAAAITLALNVASPSAEAPNGRGAMFFSLEMPAEQVATRFGCAVAFERDLPPEENPTYEDFEKGLLNDIQWQRLEEAGRKFASMPVKIDFRSKLKVSQMMAAARRQKREWEKKGIEPGVIIIDHVLQVQPEKRLNDKVVEIGQIADDILDMAKVLDMPIVLLCQLGREVDKRDDKRPNLSDLKWSGSLEENAAAVVFCYRPEYYNKVPPHDAKDAEWAKYNRVKEKFTDRLIFLLEKNRNGRANQEIEVFCRIGCNVIQNLGEPSPVARTLDFSTSRLAQDDGGFDSLSAEDVR